MSKRSVDQRDLIEFGFDDGTEQGKPTVPQLIAALPEAQREGYRDKQRSHVRLMTGSSMLTWAKYMNGERDNMSMHETEATSVATAARREIRDAFQIRSPHYTPPPWADRETWERWVEANVNMHGVRGFYDRGMHRQIHESFSSLTPPPDDDS